ncbi:hypothetical protein CR513_17474, partial [Mucuna pruriens]
MPTKPTKGARKYLLGLIHLRKERYPTQRYCKLQPRGDGPFQVIEKINDNAYKLDLPSDELDSRMDLFKEGGNDGNLNESNSLQDPLQGMEGPMTRARAKRVKEVPQCLVTNMTFHRLIRSPTSSEVANCSLNSSVFASNSTNSTNFDSDIANYDSNFGICISKFSLYNMTNNNRILKELAIPFIMCQPWCIRYPKLEQAQSYELKFGLMHLLPKFHNLVGEDTHNHL